MSTEQITDTATPRTDELRKRLDALGESVSWQDWEDLTRLSRQLERELTTAKGEITVLRQALSQIATNLGNGSAVVPDASLGFITQCLAYEVKMHCEGQRAEIARLKEVGEMLDKALDGTVKRLRRALAAETGEPINIPDMPTPLSNLYAVAAARAAWEIVGLPGRG